MGGAKAVVDILARGLQKAGHKVVLFAAGDSYCSVPGRYRFDEALGTGREVSEVLELLHVISAYENLEEFDIIHDHTLLGPFTVPGIPTPFL